MAAATLTTALRAVNEGQRQLKEYGDSVKSVGDKAEDAGKRGKSAMGGLGKSLLDVGKIAGGFVIGAGLLKLPGVFGGMMESASAFNETLSKSNTVFGENAKQIEEWADGAAKAFGQSKQQALDAAGSFGNLFRQIGFSGDSAAWLSKGMTELASDFASFHNADISEVINAQSAAFRGEYDALQKFVPTINAAAVEQQALLESGKESAKTLTAQEKAAATYTLMMKGAGDAMGDFARTSDGAANQGRILDARMADLSATMGQKLLPMKVAVVQFILDKVVPAFEKFSEWVGPKISEAIDIAKPKIQELVAWWRDDALPAIRGFVEYAQPKVAAFIDLMKEKFGEFKGYYESDIKPALENIQKAIQYVVDWTVEHWPEISRVVMPVLEQIGATIEVTKDIIVNVLQIIIDLISGDWSGAWSNAKELVGAFRDYAVETFGNLKELMAGMISGVFEIVKYIGKAILNGIKAGIEEGWDAFKGWVTGKLDPRNWDIPGLSPFLDAYQHAGQLAGQRLAEGVMGGIGSMAGVGQMLGAGLGGLNIPVPEGWGSWTETDRQSWIGSNYSNGLDNLESPWGSGPVNPRGGGGNFGGGDQTVIIQIDGAEVGRAVIRQMGRGYA